MARKISISRLEFGFHSAFVATKRIFVSPERTLTLRVATETNSKFHFKIIRILYTQLSNFPSNRIFPDHPFLLRETEPSIELCYMKSILYLLGRQTTRCQIIVVRFKMNFFICPFTVTYGTSILLPPDGFYFHRSSIIAICRSVQKYNIYFLRGGVVFFFLSDYRIIVVYWPVSSRIRIEHISYRSKPDTIIVTYTIVFFS